MGEGEGGRHQTDIITLIYSVRIKYFRIIKSVIFIGPVKGKEV